MALAPVFTALCGLLVVAGMSKLRRPGATRDALTLIRVSVPTMVVRALGSAEIALGVIAGLAPSRATALLVAAVFGGFCGFALLLMRANERATDCGCFGGSGGGLTALHVGLNAVACCAAALAAISAPPGVAWMVSRSPLIAVPLCLGVAVATLLARLAYTALAEAWRAYGTGGSL